MSYRTWCSRIVDRCFISGDTEKEHLVALMRKLEVFPGLRAVTCSVVRNHLQLLIEEADEETLISIRGYSVLIFR